MNQIIIIAKKNIKSQNTSLLSENIKHQISTVKSHTYHITLRFSNDLDTLLSDSWDPIILLKNPLTFDFLLEIHLINKSNIQIRIILPRQIFLHNLRLCLPDLPDHAHQQSTHIVVEGGAHLRCILFTRRFLINLLTLPQHICNKNTRQLPLPRPQLFASLSPGQSCSPPELQGCYLSRLLQIFNLKSF